METRNLGASDLKVPVLSFGAGTFGGKGDLFKRVVEANDALCGFGKMTREEAAAAAEIKYGFVR